MKFRVGDNVIVTAGKDKGKSGKVAKVLRDAEKVVIEDVNLYVKHMKPINGQEGQRVKRPRPLPTANVAIVNGEGKPDRIGYKINKDGSKVRIYKKTGKEIEEKDIKTKK